MSNQLIPVFNGSISNESVLLCNARDLHTFLSVGRDFSNWIRERISEYGFTENSDYIVFSPNSAKTPGRKRKDYHLTLDTAKELAMVERNEKGRQIRRYFIECEKQLRQKDLKPNFKVPRRFLTIIHHDGYQETEVVNDGAYILSAEEFLQRIVCRGITVDDQLLVNFSLTMLQRIWSDHEKQTKML